MCNERNKPTQGNKNGRSLALMLLFESGCEQIETEQLTRRTKATNTGEPALVAPAVDTCGSNVAARLIMTKESNDRPSTCISGIDKRLRLETGQICVE